MTSSENLQPWDFRPTFADSWISEAYARDTDTLTRALQKSLSNHSDSLTGDDPFSPLYDMVKPEASSVLQTPSVSGSEPETPAPKCRNSVSKGKITKRKSRASKRNPTTFINADPANFRQLVQQVTGVKLSNGHLPAAAAVLKPEPQRALSRVQGCLPTLDTSAFLLDHAGPTSTTQPVVGYSPRSFVANGGSGFDFESFSGFPTLESWN